MSYITYTYSFINLCFPYYFVSISRGQGLQNCLRVLAHQRFCLTYIGQLSFCISKPLSPPVSSSWARWRAMCLTVNVCMLRVFCWTNLHLFLFRFPPSLSAKLSAISAPNFTLPSPSLASWGGNGICVYIVLQPQFACCGEWDKGPQP